MLPYHGPQSALSLCFWKEFDFERQASDDRMKAVHFYCSDNIALSLENLHARDLEYKKQKNVCFLKIWQINKDLNPICSAGALGRRRSENILPTTD